ncbi:MAG: cysteine desulfurase family protein [Candidatus Nitrosopolaris sp.]|jgi:cysteine desulfurase
MSCSDCTSFPIYLDNAASTPMLNEVMTEMMPYFKEHYGNPSSLHRFGRMTMRAIENARTRVSSLIGCKKNEIIFTSGGTEANNLAIKGVADLVRKTNPEKKYFITSAIEHESILEAFRDLEEKGFDVRYLPVTKDAQVETADLQRIINDRTALVSIMFSNNEVGTIQSINELARITHQKGGLFHTDAIQAVGKIPIDVKQLGVDFLSASSHKINGPKGVGALYKREGLKLAAIIHGGGQESTLRSGTENVHGIVGFGKACEIAAQRIGEYETKVSALRNYMIDRVLHEVPNSRLNCFTQNRIANIAHFTLFGVNGEDLIIKLDELGIAASTGSACSSRNQRSSHVLKAMGFSYAELTGSLRLSIGILNTKEEIDQAVSILSKAVDELRKLSPFDF